jgi:hypothetical protein
MNFFVSHIYREGNECADAFANLGLGLVNFVYWNDVPHPMYDSFARNKMGFPCFRFSHWEGFGLVPPLLFVYLSYYIYFLVVVALSYSTFSWKKKKLFCNGWSIKKYICGLVRFWKINPKSDPIQRFSQKQHPNTSKNIQFFAVFGFFRSVCNFYSIWFEFEHPYLCLTHFLIKILPFKIKVLIFLYSKELRI